MFMLIFPVVGARQGTVCTALAYFIHGKKAV